MALDVRLLSRLLAYEQGCAMPCSSNRQVAIRPDALVISLLAMAGEDSTIHIAACGTLVGPPSIQAVPDPRIRDDQYLLFHWLGNIFEDYLRRCRCAATYPQIWVSSSKAASHLDVLADRLRFNKKDQLVRRFGELLTYFTERYPVSGQQALQTATQALNRHWSTGQDQSEDEHLMTLLTWIDPPPGQNVLAAVAQAERLPMGVKTNPDYDRDVLSPLVIGYNEARRVGAAPKLLGAKAQLIERALKPVVLPIYKATQRAIQLLASSGRPALPGLDALERREAAEFASFMESRDAGYHLPLRDSPKLAAFRLSAREDAAQNVDAMILLGDPLARVEGRLTGVVTRGEVLNRARIRLGTRKFRYQFQIRSTQRVLRIRLRDELRWVDDPRLSVVVTDIYRDGRSTLIRFEILKGQRAVGLPEIGEILEVLPNVPDWNSLMRERAHLKNKLEVTPWTHADGEIPRLPARPAQGDPLSAVEDLR